MIATLVSLFRYALLAADRAADRADSRVRKPCSCPPSCDDADKSPCRGECGCQACHDDYDFLSWE